MDRRKFLKISFQGLLLFIVGLFFYNSFLKGLWGRNYVWQIDPKKCVKCGRCATSCVIEPSAVKCIHQFDICGYCKLCFGYFQPGAKSLTENAENELCPTGALKRRFIEEPFFEYTIDESLCIGCAKCVKGCNLFGNGSLFLQVKQDLCQNCNDCSIARVCLGQAFKRIPASQGYFENK